jgi:hypothetical protein
MQVKIYVEEKTLEELSNFLKSSINYEHNIPFSTKNIDQRVEVFIFYDDYVRLRDWKVESDQP